MRVVLRLQDHSATIQVCCTKWLDCGQIDTLNHPFPNFWTNFLRCGTVEDSTSSASLLGAVRYQIDETFLQINDDFFSHVFQIFEIRTRRFGLGA